jgi:uncharacterized YigZ family protein
MTDAGGEKTPGASAPGGGRYPVPANRNRVEEVIQRSRFITTVGRAADVEAAKEFVKELKDEFPDATHNCWAFVAGPPGSTAFVGMSDEGEPHGTAGRPMLNVLLHSGVGEIVAVVTRYYGGVKLGTGGLVRAYSSGVQLALGSLRTMEKVDRAHLRIQVEYPHADAVRRLLEGGETVVLSESYGAAVELEIAVPVEGVDDLRRQVAGITRGAGVVETLSDEEEA